MPDWPIWVWLLIAAIALIIIFAIIAGANRQKTVARQEASELRDRAAQDEHLLGVRQSRAEELTAQAEASHAAAAAGAERAEALRAEAERAEEAAAPATEDAEVLGGEAARSQAEYEDAVATHDDLLREADRKDPDVRTDREGHRLDEPARAAEVVEEDTVIDEEVPAQPHRSAEVDPREADTGLAHHGVDPDGDGYVDRAPEEDLRLSDADRPLDDTTDADEPAHVPAEDQPARAEDIFDQDHPRDEQGRRLDPYGNPIEHDGVEVDEALVDDRIDHDDVPRDEQGRRLDPYGNPIEHDGVEVDEALVDDRIDHDDVPRDEQGRRLDPYGNPIDHDAVGTDETVVDDRIDHDDVPRDEQGRRLDPYGNPVPEDR